MEEQVKITKSSKRFKVLASVIAVVCVCAMVIGLFFMKQKAPVSPVESDSVVEVNDEATLRKLLLEDSELEITLTDDIAELEEGFVVNGTKTLKGDSTIQMKLSAKGGQSVFSVSSKATFIMNGITIDANGVSDGIYVNYDAELKVEDGDIIWAAANAIKTNGLVTIQDINIDHSLHTAIQSANAGKVYMKGGNVLDSGYGHVYIAKSGYVNIEGNPKFDGAIGHGIQNDGTLDVKGGTYSNSGWYAIANYGTAKIEYSGSADGYIKITETGTGGVYNATGATTSLAGIHMYDIGTHAFKSVSGTSTVTDCHFERTGNTALQLIECDVKVENVKSVDAKGCGLYAEKKANIEVNNFTVENCSARGVMSNGATITGDTISIIKPGSYGITNSKLNDIAGVVTVSNVSIVDSQKNGLNANGADLIAKNIEILNTNNIAAFCGGGATLTLENATLKGFKEKEEAVHVKEDSTIRMKGKSIITGVVVRAVGVEGTFIMDGGSICDNNVTYNGAAVYVYKTGSFVMNGGTICNNTTTVSGAGIQVKKDGKVTINGGKICNNTSVGNGAGINADTGAFVYLKSGSITGNKTAGAGDGVCASGEVTIGKNFYMGSDEIKIGNIGVTLKIEGNELSKHSEKDPLRVTPVLSSPMGTEVVECNSEEDAKALSKVVGSGDGSFALVQDQQYFKVQFTTADMDMTGADTVYVSDFAALKEAAEGTTGKRYIVLQSDIKMESRVRIPGGATIYIKDDGVARTLSRADKNGAAFFETSYGTGLYLVGTKDGNLILNGAVDAQVAPANIKPLVVAKGSTVIEGVKLSNNGSMADGVTMMGALVQQLYADITIKDSEFTNGKAIAGGAILLENAKAYIENCNFTDNQCVKGGGAIRSVKNSELEIVNSTFASNESGTLGGVINSDGSDKLVVTDCSFTGNKAGTFAGAINVSGEGNVAFITKTTDNDSLIFADNVAETHGGALRVAGGAKLIVEGYEFVGNSTVTHHGGAIFVDEKSTGIIKNSAFYENSAASAGGAIATSAGNVDVISCEFGEEGRGNTAGANGGAIYATGNGTIEMTLATEDGIYNSMNYNTASESGGAVFVNSGVVKIDGYQLNHNSAVKTGGALYVKLGHRAEVKNSTFTGNASTSSSGGAATVYGTLSVSDTSFVKNTATTNGGAIACYVGNVTGENVVFTENTARDAGAVYLGEKASASFTGDVEHAQFVGNTVKNQGGAILAKDGSTLSVDGYLFTTNKSVGHGGAVYVDGASTTAAICNSIFTENTSAGSGGAVATNAGTINISNTDFEKNGATNGGAIYQTGDGAIITLTVENGKSGSFTDNYAMAGDNRRGGAIRINGGEMILSGYTFENNSVEKAYNNCNTGKGNAIYVAANKELQISDCTFVSNGDVYLETGAKAYLSGNLQDVLFVYQSNGENVIFGNEKNDILSSESKVSIQPVYEEGSQVLRAQDAVQNVVKVVNDANNRVWLIDSDGKLQCDEQEQYHEAKIGDVYYSTLEAAVTAAHEDTTSEKVEIIVLGNVEISSRLDIYRNIVLKNASGEDVVITGDFVSLQLIRVWKENDVTCTLEIGGTEEGSITIDGTGRTTGASLIRNDEGCTFTLGANAAVINGGATSNGSGAGLYNKGIAHLYGDFIGNDATNGGAVYNEDTGSVNIYGGTYSGNTAKQYGGAIFSKGVLKVANATFKENYVTSYQGGAIYHTTKQFQIDGCTFDGNYTVANHGGAMFVANVATNDTSPSYIKDSFFHKNSAGGTSSSGGAIAFNNVTLPITDCQFGGTDEEGNSLGNIAGRRAGAIYQTGGGTITITSTTKQHVFANNTCGEAFGTNAGGGALYSNSGTINVTGYIFENNKAADVNNDTSITDNAGNIVLNESPVYEAKVGSVYYNTLEEAVTAAHADTTSEKVEITVLGNVVLSARQDIKRDMVIKNLSGKDVVISGDFTDLQLIRVWKENDVTCTLEIGGTEEGSITIDGTGRTTGASLIRNDEGCTFTLGANAAVINGGATSNGSGAGLYNKGIAHLYGDFIGNDATNGGAVYNEDTGSVNIYGGTYSGNTAKQYGGAIYSKGILKVNNATFTENYVTVTQGGAIYHTAKQIQIDGCTFNGNYTTANHGGAMYVKGVTTSTNTPSYIQNTAFYKNSAGGTSSSGGAVAFEGTTLSITDCQFGGTDEEGNSLGNIAGRRAGAIYQTAGGTITITSTTKQHVFANNTCGEAFGTNAGGGALYSNSGTMNVTGYIFENNKAAGANNNTSITSSSGAVKLTDCTEK